MKLPSIFDFLLSIFSFGRRNESSKSMADSPREGESLAFTVTSTENPGDWHDTGSQDTAQPVPNTPPPINDLPSLSNKIAITPSLSPAPKNTSTDFVSPQIISPDIAGPSYGGFPPPSYGGFPAADYGGFPTPSYGGFPDSSYGGFPAPSYGGFPEPSYGGFPPPSYGGFPTSSDYSMASNVIQPPDSNATVMPEPVKNKNPISGWGADGQTSPDPASFVFESNNKVNTDPLTIDDGKDHKSNS